MYDAIQRFFASLLFVALVGCSDATRTAVTEDPELDEWWAEYRKVSESLEAFQDRVVAQHKTRETATEAEETFFICLSYWLTAVVNSGDIFGHLDYIIGHEEKFAAIGATKTLVAKEKLLLLYEEMTRKPTDRE